MSASNPIDDGDRGLTTSMFVVRHGQSTWNERGLWQGQADPPLSEFGQEQATMAANAIGQVDAIVSSPQQRALGTAAIIGNRIGVGPIQTLDGLRERSVGPWSGLTKAQIEAEWPGWIDSDERPEGWEFNVDLRARVIAALQQINAEFPGASVLVVAHGGVIINLEEYLGVNESRIPNLHGRVVSVGPKGMTAGEPLALLPDEMRTGGRSKAL